VTDIERILTKIIIAVLGAFSGSLAVLVALALRSVGHHDALSQKKMDLLNALDNTE
jgi:hypothetical protein